LFVLEQQHRDLLGALRKSRMVVRQSAMTLQDRSGFANDLVAQKVFFFFSIMKIILFSVTRSTI
jgi:hypothetical protein